MSDFGPAVQWSRKGTVEKIVLKYLKKKFNIRTMIDIGCGEGRQVEFARKIHINCIGVDGSPSLGIYKKSYFTQHDYTIKEYEIGHFDLGWSVEFVEHVYDKYIPNFMNTFTHCKFILCTHAVPGQKGKHHVNCQKEAYWVEMFRKYGIKQDIKQTMKIRQIAKVSHIKKTGLFFRNEDFSEIRNEEKINYS